MRSADCNIDQEIAVNHRFAEMDVDLSLKLENIFLSSGFKLRSNAHTSPQPLDQPIILSVDQGNTGQLLAWIKAFSRLNTTNCVADLRVPAAPRPFHG